MAVRCLTNERQIARLASPQRTSFRVNLNQNGIEENPLPDLPYWSLKRPPSNENLPQGWTIYQTLLRLPFMTLFIITAQAVNPSSKWHTATDMWFLSGDFTTGLDSTSGPTPTEHRWLIWDRPIGQVSQSSGRRRLAACPNPPRCECNQTCDRQWVRSWVGTAQFGFMQISRCGASGDIFFSWVRTVVPARWVSRSHFLLLSTALLLLGIMWAVLSKCTWADGFECVCVSFSLRLFFHGGFSPFCGRRLGRPRT